MYPLFKNFREFIELFENSNVLEKVRKSGEIVDFLYNYCPYFWGKISNEQAKEILKKRPKQSLILYERNLLEAQENYNFELIIHHNNGVYSRCLFCEKNCYNKGHNNYCDLILITYMIRTSFAIFFGI